MGNLVIFLIFSLCFFYIHPAIALERSVEQRIQEIDQEISRLSEELHEYRIKKMSDEIKAQQSMKYDWGFFSKKIEKEEQDEQRIQNINEIIRSLNKEKEEILQQQNYVQ